MTVPPGATSAQFQPRNGPDGATAAHNSSDTPAGREFLPILLVDRDVLEEIDPGVVVLVCANCGAAMDERRCKLICRCGYFLSCSDRN